MLQKTLHVVGTCLLVLGFSGVLVPAHAAKPHPSAAKPHPLKQTCVDLTLRLYFPLYEIDSYRDLHSEYTTVTYSSKYRERFLIAEQSFSQWLTEHAPNSNR